MPKIELEREEGTWYVDYDNQYIGFIEETQGSWTLCFVGHFPIAKQIEILQQLEKAIADRGI